MINSTTGAGTFYCPSSGYVTNATGNHYECEWNSSPAASGYYNISMLSWNDSYNNGSDTEYGIFIVAPIELTDADVDPDPGGWGRGRGGWGRGMAWGRPWGGGYGRGMGWGRRAWAAGPVPHPAWGAGPCAPELTPEQETTMLKDEAKALQEELKAINARIGALEKAAKQK